MHSIKPSLIPLPLCHGFISSPTGDLPVEDFNNRLVFRLSAEQEAKQNKVVLPYCAHVCCRTCPGETHTEYVLNLGITVEPCLVPRPSVQYMHARGEGLVNIVRTPS